MSDLQAELEGATKHLRVKTITGLSDALEEAMGDHAEAVEQRDSAWLALFKVRKELESPGHMSARVSEALTAIEQELEGVEEPWTPEGTL